MAKPTKRDIAKAVLELSRRSKQDSAKEIAAYLSVNQRTSELDAIMRAVSEIQAEDSGLVEVTVTTAFPATNQVKQQVKTLIGAKNIIINEVVDKSVIGGVRIESKDIDLDLTVRGRLDRFKTTKTGVL